MSRSFMGREIIATVAAIGLIGTAANAILVDGAAELDYGAPRAVQDTQTQFGDSTGTNNGSELDQGFGQVDGGTLYLMLAGNLQNNFNKVEIFIDSIAGGQNQLRGDNPDVDFNGLNRMGDDGGGNGLKFDAGFEPDFYYTFTWGNVPGEMFGNAAELLTLGGGSGGYLGSIAVPGGIGSGMMGAISVGFNDSNTAGVTGGTGPDSGAGVLTGLELGIPLSLIGNPTGDIMVSAFINGSGHDFLANQVLGGIGGGANLGEPRNVDFSLQDGDQFFTIPEPATGLLLGLGALVIAWRRRRVAG